MRSTLKTGLFLQEIFFSAQNFPMIFWMNGKHTYLVNVGIPTILTEVSTSGSGSGLSVSIGSPAGFSSEVEGAGPVNKYYNY